MDLNKTTEKIKKSKIGKKIAKADHSEGRVARAIEQQTAKLPSDTFLWTALGAVGLSAVLKMRGKDQHASFVGQWVAPFLLLGLYNKIVKVFGSDNKMMH